jgi:alpha-1,3-rhamnosyltransferase
LPNATPENYGAISELWILERRRYMPVRQEQPLVSILIPSFNHGRYVQACIKSVIGQDYKNIELIIIDDGSSDDSADKISDLVNECTERFTRFEFRCRPNKGLSGTINEALDWCEGLYFSTIASDDLMISRKTSTLVRYLMNNGELAGAFSGCFRIDENGNQIAIKRATQEVCSFKDIILRKTNLIAPSQLLRLDCVRRVGGYKNDLYIEDLYMWLALTESGYKLGVVDDILVNYRQHDSNACANPAEMYKHRIPVFGYFSGSPLYPKAMAVNSVLVSHYFATFSKSMALKYLHEGFIHCKSIVFTMVFIKGIINILVPQNVLNFVRAKRS